MSLNPYAKPRQKVQPFVSKVLRDFAKGQPCAMQSPFCNHDPATVVLCHGRRGAGAGMGEKPHDFWGYHGCSGCHEHESEIPTEDLYRAIRETQWRVYEEFRSLTP